MAMRLAFFASGNGTTMRNIAGAIADGVIAAEAVLLISNKPDCPAMQWAKAHGIPTRAISRKTHPDDSAGDKAMLAALREARADLVILSGYVQKLSVGLLSALDIPVINIHPALLPDFGGQGMYGRHVHEAVLAARRRESGATVHFVTEVYDTGPIIAQRRVPVQRDDTVESLAARVEAAEKELMIETVRAIAAGELRLDKLPGRSNSQ
jgi:phosphoribosylglycinamide formyltransferase-1